MQKQKIDKRKRRERDNMKKIDIKNKFLIFALYFIL